MKRNFAIVLTVVAVVAVGLALSSRPARANNGALIVRDLLCQVFDGNGNPQIVTQTIFVENNNVVKITCKGIVPNNTGSAVHWGPDNNPIGPGTQYSCQPSATPSTDWHTTVSANGLSDTNITCVTPR